MLFIATIFAGSAKRIDENQAARIAQNFTKHKISTPNKIASVSKKAAYAPKANGEPLFYIFNNGNNTGFTIVCGDDRLPGIIGYSDSGDFDSANIPPNFKYWLEQSEQEIKWYYLHGGKERIIETKDRSIIPPMLKTYWGQGSPYNVLCSTPQSHPLTGCIATAMAQVLNYNKWPDAGEGILENPEDSTQTFEFSQYKIDYANMLSNYSYNEYKNGAYSEEEVNAVASLMLVCGQASSIKWGVLASGSTDHDMQLGLIKYLKYNPGTKLILRDLIGNEKWEDVIYNEIALQRPVLMCGALDTGNKGHCFIVDGYGGEGLFHFDWGWDGSYNGYFALYNLTPDPIDYVYSDNTFNTRQTAIIELTPAGTNDTNPQKDLKINGHQEYKYIEEDQCHAIAFVDDKKDGALYNYTGLSQIVRMSVAFENADNPEEITYVRGWGDAPDEEGVELKPNYGFLKIDFNPPTLNDGNYKIYAVAQFFDDDKYYRVPSDINQPQYVTATVKDGVITYNNMSPDNTKHDIIITGYYGFDNNSTVAPFYGKIKFTNISDGDSSFTMLYWMEPQEHPNINGSASVFIPAGRSVEIELVKSDIPVTTEYTTAFRPFKDNNLVYSPLEFKVENCGESQTDSNIIINHRIIDLNTTPEISLRFDRDSSEPVQDILTFNLIRRDEAGTQDGTVNIYTTEEITFEHSRTSYILNTSFLKDVTPGKYVWHITSKNGNIDSQDIPISITKYSEDEDSQIAYIITDGQAKEAYLCAPHDGHYKGEVTVPAKIGEVTLSPVLGNGAFTMNKDVTQVTIPASVTEIYDGTFYGADNISRFTFEGNEAPVLGQKALPEDLSDVEFIIPNNSANCYARTRGWEEVPFGAWTIETIDGITLSSQDMAIDPATQRIFEPYYVGENEQVSVKISNGVASKVYAVIFLDNGTFSITELENDNFILPAIGKAKGKVVFAHDISSVPSIDEAPEVADLYNIDGFLIAKNIPIQGLLSQPKGIYVWNNKKFVLK